MSIAEKLEALDKLGAYGEGMSDMADAMLSSMRSMHELMSCNALFCKDWSDDPVALMGMFIATLEARHKHGASRDDLLSLAATLGRANARKG